MMQIGEGSHENIWFRTMMLSAQQMARSFEDGCEALRLQFRAMKFWGFVTQGTLMVLSSGASQVDEITLIEFGGSNSEL